MDLAYDPGAFPIRSLADLKSLAEDATRTSRPFYVSCPRYQLAKERSAEEMEYLETSGLFDQIGKLYGLDEERCTVVYRFHGAKPKE